MQKRECQGRMPWFDKNGQPIKPYLIGICGGTASGKTTVSQRIISNLGVPWISLLSMDSFYRPLNKSQLESAHRNEFNFDHPDSADHDLIYETLSNIKKVDIPSYDFTSHSRLSKTTPLYGANVIIFEGILVFHDKRIRELMDLKLFVDTDADVRLARRLQRDIAERGRDIEGVLYQYNKFVKPAFDDYIYPTMKYSDIIIPRGSENTTAIDFITKHIQRQLDSRGLSLRPELSISSNTSPNVVLLPMTNQVRFLNTMIRDVDCCRKSFIKHTNHLSRLLVEHAIEELYAENGADLQDALKVCVISTVKGGAALEIAFRNTVKSISIGKILIDSKDSNPHLHYIKFPKLMSGFYTFIIDDQIATGSAAIMAIRVVLDHQVPQSQIIYVSLIASRLGVSNIANAFPLVRVVCGSVEDYEIEDGQFIKSGSGDFAKRYFGT